MAIILIVDDETGILNSLQRLLVRQLPKSTIHTRNTPQAALDLLDQQVVEVIICDYAMPAMNGIDFLKEAKLRQPSASRLLLSAASDSGILKRAINEASVEYFIQKPWQDVEVIEAIEKALTDRASILEDRELADYARLIRQNQQTG